MKIYEPNYTQVPNAIFSLMPELKESELKVLLAIVRKTIGWKKHKDRISLTQLQEITGLGRASVSEAIKSENLKGVIKVHKTKKGNVYEMIIHSMNSELPPDQLVQNLNYPSMNSEPVASMNSEHTKETITKETIQKKADKSAIPSLSDVISYFEKKGYDSELATKFYEYYNEPMEDKGGRVWKDQNGKTVKSWKQKALAVWMKDDNRNNNLPPSYNQEFL